MVFVFWVGEINTEINPKTGNERKDIFKSNSDSNLSELKSFSTRPEIQKIEKQN